MPWWIGEYATICAGPFGCSVGFFISPYPKIALWLVLAAICAAFAWRASKEPTAVRIAAAVATVYLATISLTKWLWDIPAP